MGSIATVPGFNLNPDTSSFYQGEPSGADKSMSLSATQPPSTTLTMPTGGAPEDSQNLGLYAPQKPNLLSYGTGIGNMERLYQQIYGKNLDDIGKPPGQKGLSEAPTTDSDDTKSTEFTPDPNLNKPVTEPTFNLGDTNRAVGSATTFGLDYDTAGYDQEDNGKGAFGYNTRNKDLEGASLPISVIKGSIGDYTSDPKVFNAIKNGEYKVAVTNEDGTTRVVPIVDAGPAEWTGNAVDLTYKTSHDLGTQGKAKVGYQIIGPDGHTIPVRGYHSESTSRVNYDDHIGSNRKVQVDNTVNNGKVTTKVNGEDIEDMGEKPKEGRSETTTSPNSGAPKKKVVINPKTGKPMTDADYGRYGVDVPAEEENAEIDRILKEGGNQ